MVLWLLKTLKHIDFFIIFKLKILYYLNTDDSNQKNFQSRENKLFGLT